jgi:hypothetical protein
MFIRPAHPGGAAAAARARAAVAPSGPRPEENPLLALEIAADDPRREEENRFQRRAGSLLLGVAVGAGYGWHPQRRLEYRRDLKVAPGNGLAGRPQILPEVGYQLTRRLAVSLQCRYQVVGTEGWGDIREGAPRKQAWALLARARHLTGSRRARFLLSAAVGAGDAIRVEVPATPDSNLPRNDTVAGGPFVAGPGAGFLYHLHPNVAFVTELRALAGFPRFATTLDLGAGLELAF